MKTLLPTIVGGALAISGGFLAKFYNDFREKKSLKAALAAEIGSFLDMLEREKLQELFRDTLVKIKEEKCLPLFPVSFRNTYSIVFSGSASKIGSLDPKLLNRLVRYYYKIQTLVELGDIFSATLEDIYERGAEEDSEEIAEQVETLEDMIKTAEQARSEAIDLVNELDPPGD